MSKFYVTFEIDESLMKIRENLRRYMLASWKSGDEMANFLSAEGLCISPGTCRNWRNGKTEPSYSIGTFIKKSVVKKAEIDINTFKEIIDEIPPK